MNLAHIENFTLFFSSVVEFTYSKDAQKAIKELDGSEMKGRKVKVREVKFKIKVKFTNKFFWKCFSQKCFFEVPGRYCLC